MVLHNTVSSTGSIITITMAHSSKYFTSTPKKLIQLELMRLVARSLRDSHLCVFSGALLHFVRKTPLCCTVSSTGSMTVAQPSKYFTSTPKKLIQLELSVWWQGHCVIVICVFSQALCCNFCAKRDLAAQFHQNRTT